MNEKIGFIGLGKMGLPMAKNLLNSGHTVFGYDINQEALSEFIFSGGKSGHIREWINKVNFIILMLPSSTIVNKVLENIVAEYTSENFSHQDPLMIIDMSSSYPSETIRNYRMLEKNSIYFMDAPVSGGVQKALDGSLTIMFGGTHEQFGKCKRLLSAIGSNLYHVGPIGSGHLMKAMNNYLSATHLLASCEAIKLLETFQVQPEIAINILNKSTGRSGSTEYKFPNFILNEKYNSGFSLELLRKDVEIAMRLFKEADAQTALPQLIYDKYHEAASVLENDADHTEINRFVSSYLLKRGILND